MPRFMLDTDISSYIMKRSSPVLLKRLQAVAVQDVCISAITKSELVDPEKPYSSCLHGGLRADQVPPRQKSA
jgi:tRNA(fMet)-specific endonuclease VapC